MSGKRRTDDYQPFPDIPARNALQARLEIPLVDLALGLPRGSSVLEIGCGRGIGLGVFARRLDPERLAGVDVDRQLLGLAQGDLHADGVEAQLVAGDARALPFPDSSFDLIVDFGTLFHISEPDLALADIKRVLRPDGQFVNETRVSQLMAHPFRGLSNGLAPEAVDTLGPVRARILWASHQLAADSV